jgi:hypothetical protein
MEDTVRSLFRTPAMKEWELKENELSHGKKERLE